MYNWNIETVLGDVNDEPRAATTQFLLGPEDWDVTKDDRVDPCGYS
jgi:hypothetical protein